MIEYLQNISSQCNNDFIVIGGVARYLKGYYGNYEKKVIDVAVSTDSLEVLRTMGGLRELSGDAVFPYPVKGRYVYLDSYRVYFLDVFVREMGEIEYTTINDLKVNTDQDDLNFVQHMYNYHGNSHWEIKLNDLKQLYGVNQ